MRRKNRGEALVKDDIDSLKGVKEYKKHTNRKDRIRKMMYGLATVGLRKISTHCELETSGIYSCIILALCVPCLG